MLRIKLPYYIILPRKRKQARKQHKKLVRSSYRGLERHTALFRNAADAFCDPVRGHPVLFVAFHLRDAARNYSAVNAFVPCGAFSARCGESRLHVAEQQITRRDPERLHLVRDGAHKTAYRGFACRIERLEGNGEHRRSGRYRKRSPAGLAQVRQSVSDKIEYAEKVHRRETARFAARNEPIGFDENNRNEISDDGILNYRDRLHVEQIPEGGDFFKIFADKKKVANSKLFKALAESLMPDFSKRNLREYFALPKNRTTYFNELIKFYKKAPAAFFQGKAETFLTCISVSSYLKKGYLDAQTGSMFEEASLNALCKTFMASITLLDARLILAELPRLLAMPYASAGSLLSVCLEIFPQFVDEFRKQGDMKNFEELSYILNMLKTFAVRVR